MAKQICQDCKFFQQLDRGPLGTCRKNPPVVLWMDEENEFVSLWPEVIFGEWCGEWKPRQENHQSRCF